MLGNLPIMSLIKSRMHYHQSRQKLLAENVANADSPGFRPHDLKPFDAHLAAKASGAGMVQPSGVPQPGHINMAGGTGGNPQQGNARLFERTPSGNAVNLEDEMMRMAQNASDYQLATSLYSKSMGFLKLALGKRA
jgi:flagellar basal-body rod protein FlgB